MEKIPVNQKGEQASEQKAKMWLVEIFQNGQQICRYKDVIRIINWDDTYVEFVYLFAGVEREANIILKDGIAIRERFL